MKRHLAAAILVACLATTARADANPPYAAMRTLQALQEQVAHGAAAAQAAQPKLMDHIAEGFLATDAAAWKEPRNARAAILFLFSGGKPAVIRSIMDAASFPADLDRLLKGALAYGEGQDDVARALLEPIDPQTLPTALGGHFALVKANLLADKDIGEALKLLDTARLLAPGTLIEEAALRREVFLLADAGTVDKAMLLSRQYFRRYRASGYAGSFRQGFGSMAIKMASSGNTAQLIQLDTVLSDLPPAETRSFYLTIARALLTAGQTGGTRFAAQRVLALAAKGSVEETRAKLYLGASLVAVDPPTTGLALLDALDPARLPPEEAALRVAALAVGAAVQADVPTGSDNDPGNAKDDPVQATIDRARMALANGGRLLASTAPAP